MIQDLPITEHDVAHFRDQGFLAVPDLVSPHELAELKDDIVRIARGHYDTPAITPLPSSVSDDEALQRILCVHQPHFASEVIKRYTEHPAIAAVLSQIVGAHLREFWDHSVKCMQSMFFVKPPGKPGQAWHQDEIYIPTRDRSLCGAWIAVDDATIDNGCLWVLPESHKAGKLYPQRDHQQHGTFDFAPESYGFDDRAEIPVEVKAGSVVFFNGYLLHRSKPNHSQGYRRVLVNHYCSGQTLLPWAQTEFGGSVATYDNRVVHMVAGEDANAQAGFTAADPHHVHLRADGA